MRGGGNGGGITGARIEDDAPSPDVSVTRAALAKTAAAFEELTPLELVVLLGATFEACSSCFGV